MEQFYDIEPGPKQHVARPNLPWRPVEITECGRPLADLSILTFEELTKKLRVQGKQRAVMSTCMTCLETCTRWKRWEDSPVDVLRREVPSWHGDARSERMNDELRAIAALIEAHRQQFDDYVAGLQQASSLGARRRLARQRTPRSTPRPL